MEYSSYHVNVPQWREITVGSHLPAELRRFAEMAHNLWWTWNEDAKSLYSGLNPELWEEAEQNPVLFLERMDYEELEALTHDGNFMRKMENVYSTFKAYLDVEPDHSRPSVAYFSMEYGLDRVLKIYSGGLGILAGDYLKEASDSNVDLCAVGLLYRYGYFDQALAMDGQRVEQKVARAVQEGARVALGGKAVEGKGYYYPPTLLLDVRQEMTIMHEETFGPVLPVVAFDTLEEALEMANDSDYGLTSSVYTQNLNVAMKAIGGLKFGETYINRENFEAMQGFHAGWRKSGIGGADGKHGLNEYLQTQVVYLQF